MHLIQVIAVALIIVLAMVRHVVDEALGAELEGQRRFVILTRLAARRSRLGADQIETIDCAVSSEVQQECHREGTSQAQDKSYQCVKSWRHSKELPMVAPRDVRP